VNTVDAVDTVNTVNAAPPADALPGADDGRAVRTLRAPSASVTALVPAQRQGPAPLALASLPPAAVLSVRAAYAREVTRRLPALESALDRLTGTGGPVDIEAAVRDAHSLASSSAVVGEVMAARCLREVEVLLGEGSFRAAAQRFEIATLALDPWRSGSDPA
jgi:HPt (histidine-containing phosphotransfer) domain-containing protein